MEARIAAASQIFGSLSKLVFQSTAVSLPAKREAYVALILAILLYGNERRYVTAELWGKLHGPPVRACHVPRHSVAHTWASHYHR